MRTGPHIVSDVMTHTVVAVGRDAPFRDVVQLMQEWKISAVPVLAGEGRVIGVVSEADLLLKEEFRDSDPDRITQMHRLPDLAKAGGMTAADVMNTPAVTVHADATLTQAARVMAQRKVKRLPVVDDKGLLEGVVSRADLLKVFLRADDEIAEEIRREILAPLFPATTEPVRVDVADGVVTLTGRVRDTSLVPVITRLVRSVEGVVDVDMPLSDGIPVRDPE
ncbi:MULTISPECIES: CBS domain-containing protein [Streptomyces]|uniref:CBS domain-containing protein n=1 Tax=Streptomyces rochei TaxID=1928 RepID=A0ABW7E9K5_STRRO|nr:MULTISPECIES: CBS domain-containing protein [Streptomyces]